MNKPRPDDRLAAECDPAPGGAPEVIKVGAVNASGARQVASRRGFFRGLVDAGAGAPPGQPA